MQFLYNPRKAAQAAAYVVRLNGGRMEVFWLVKILYLADRAALVYRGRPITGDRMVSMPHGPVLSRIYDIIKTPNDAQPWYDLLSEREVNTVSLLTDNPPTDELSDFERRILEQEFRQYHTLGFTALKKLTHSLPEYEDPQGGSLPIDPAVILRESGWSEEDIRDAQMGATEERFIAAITSA